MNYIESGYWPVAAAERSSLFVTMLLGDPELSVMPENVFLISKVDPIEPYWRNEVPFTITATAFGVENDVENIALWYRYSNDNSGWGPWVPFGVDYAAPWGWSFDAPCGNGYYEFYSVAVDNVDHVEGAPLEADARCGVDTWSPPAPTLISPPNGALIDDNTPTFRWGAVSDPSGVTYTLQYSIDSTFGAVTITVDGIINKGDLDHDGDVDEDDYQIIHAAIGHSVGDPAYNPEADYDGDGRVTLVDYQIWILYYRDFMANEITYTVPADAALVSGRYYWRNCGAWTAPATWATGQMYGTSRS